MQDVEILFQDEECRRTADDVGCVVLLCVCKQVVGDCALRQVRCAQRERCGVKVRVINQDVRRAQAVEERRVRFAKKCQGSLYVPATEIELAYGVRDGHHMCNATNGLHDPSRSA